MHGRQMITNHDVDFIAEQDAIGAAGFRPTTILEHRLTSHEKQQPQTAQNNRRCSTRIPSDRPIPKDTTASAITLLSLPRTKTSPNGI